MKNLKYTLEIQKFAKPTFTPDNVLMSDAPTGTVPVEQGMAIIEEVMNGSAVMALAKQEPMTALKKQFTYLTGAGGAYWVDEGERIQTSKPTWLTATMEAKKLGVIIPVTKEFLNYTAPQFFEEIKPLIAEAFYKKFDQAVLFGNETPYVANTSIWENITNAGNTIVLGSTGTVYEDLNALIATIEDADVDPNGIATTRRFNKDLRGAVDGNGIPIFNTATERLSNEVLGLPIAYADGASWDGTKAVAITGDWDYARYGILQDIEYSISQDATLTTIVDEAGDPVNLFERDMFALRATMHIAFMTLKEDAFGAITPTV